MIVMKDNCVRELWIVVVEGNIYEPERRKMGNATNNDLHNA